MSKLKLFVSHSSRLDDIDHAHADNDHNWRLLADTCKAIRDHYGDRVDVLVDKEGLMPGEDWNHQLNLWLAECHVAIILFSKRAIEKSNWVAKEAAILSWRRELDPEFTLIPVLLDGETCPEDLAKDFFGVLKIDASQCIRNVAVADDILNELITALRAPDELIRVCRETPLERIQESFADSLAEETTEANLEAALKAIGTAIPPFSGSNKKKHLANLLVRQLFHDGLDYFGCFTKGLDVLIPAPLQAKIEELFRQIRSLWVDPGAAGEIPRALDHKQPLAIYGKCLTHADSLLGTVFYTLERYIERAWIGSKKYLSISIDPTMEIDQIKNDIRAGICGDLKTLPPGIAEPLLDQQVNQDHRVIVLFVHSPNPDGGLPDPRCLVHLINLHSIYEKLIVILQIQETGVALPERVKAITPQLDSNTEYKALLGERSARTFLDQKYGISR